MLYIIKGPSGSGKSSIAESSSLCKMTSITTRKPRDGEQQHIDYYFYSIIDWNNLMEKGEIIEWTKYDGQFYGLSKTVVDLMLQEHKDVFCIMDKNGVKQMKKNYDENKIKVIYITAPFWQCFNRVRKRSGLWKAITRMFHAIITGEFFNYKNCDYFIDNRNCFLEQSKLYFNSIINNH